MTVSQIHVTCKAISEVFSIFVIIHMQSHFFRRHESNFSSFSLFYYYFAANALFMLLHHHKMPILYFYMKQLKSQYNIKVIIWIYCFYCFFGFFCIPHIFVALASILEKLVDSKIQKHAEKPQKSIQETQNTWKILKKAQNVEIVYLLCFSYKIRKRLCKTLLYLWKLWNFEKLSIKCKVAGFVFSVECRVK